MMKQCDEECRADRYHVIGTRLLPGMHALPQRIIKKDGKSRLVTDHSSGKYAPNSLLSKEGYSVGGDKIGDFVKKICQAYMQAEGKPLVLFKSDVAKAYRNLPMHPYWQARQVVKIGEQFYIDRCNSFGSRASGLIWCTFYSLVLWIAEHRKCIHDLFAYVDDNFSFDYADNMCEYNGKYKKEMPKKQASLLRLWDHLGIPHEEKKQLCGQELEVIGYKINVRTLQMRLPDRVRDDLLGAIAIFVNAPTDRPVPCKPLRDFHQIRGRINWASTFHSPLRIGAASLHKEITSHTETTDSRPLNRRVNVNKAIIQELAWLVAHIQHWKGASLYSTSTINRALEIHCDACPTGIGFYCGGLQRASYAPVAFKAPFDDINFIEAFAVACAINWAASLKPRRQYLRILCDNTNAVNMFTHFQPIKVEFNFLLMESVNVVTALELDVTVQHIDRSRNKIADMLSRNRIDEVRKELPPRAIIQPFRIPDELLRGAVSNQGTPEQYSGSNAQTTLLKRRRSSSNLKPSYPSQIVPQTSTPRPGGLTRQHQTEPAAPPNINGQHMVASKDCSKFTGSGPAIRRKPSTNQESKPQNHAQQKHSPKQVVTQAPKTTACQEPKPQNQTQSKLGPKRVAPSPPKQSSAPSKQPSAPIPPGSIKQPQRPTPSGPGASTTRAVARRKSVSKPRVPPLK